MALSHATYRGTIFVPGGFVGDRRTLRLPGAVRVLHAAFFTALGWLVLGSLFCLTFVIFAVGPGFPRWLLPIAEKSNTIGILKAIPTRSCHDRLGSALDRVCLAMRNSAP